MVLLYKNIDKNSVYHEVTAQLCKGKIINNGFQLLYDLPFQIFPRITIQLQNIKPEKMIIFYDYLASHIFSADPEVSNTKSEVQKYLGMSSTLSYFQKTQKRSFSTYIPYFFCSRVTQNIA